MDVGDGHTAPGGVHRQKPTKKKKQPNKKIKPIKVVYISNPMKVQTSAAKFMALVQQLTGQDADFPDPSKFPAAVCGGDAPAADEDADLATNDYSPSSLGAELPAEDDLLIGSFYDDFVDDLILPPLVVGSFSGLLPPAASAAAMCESYAR